MLDTLSDDERRELLAAIRAMRSRQKEVDRAEERLFDTLNAIGVMEPVVVQLSDDVSVLVALDYEHSRVCVEPVAVIE